MTKAEAIKILINDFHNQCIATDWDLCEVDKEICQVLKIKIPKNRFLLLNREEVT